MARPYSSPVVFPAQFRLRLLRLLEVGGHPYITTFTEPDQGLDNGIKVVVVVPERELGAFLDDLVGPAQPAPVGLGRGPDQSGPEYVRDGIAPDDLVAGRVRGREFRNRDA